MCFFSGVNTIISTWEKKKKFCLRKGTSQKKAAPVMFHKHMIRFWWCALCIMCTIHHLELWPKYSPSWFLQILARHRCLLWMITCVCLAILFLHPDIQRRQLIVVRSRTQLLARNCFSSYSFALLLTCNFSLSSVFGEKNIWVNVDPCFSVRWQYTQLDPIVYILIHIICVCVCACLPLSHAF